MEVVIELPRDVDKLCRTCMNIVEEDGKKCIFNDDDTQDIELNNMLLYLTDTTILPNECFPRFMCSECIKKLEIAYAFKKQCQATYLNFRDFMEFSDDPDLKDDIHTHQLPCSVCEHLFSSEYKLRKHEISHYKENNLFTRYKDEEKEDVKENLVHEDYNEILSLIEERKQTTSEGIHENDVKVFVKKIPETIYDNVLSQPTKENVDETKFKICDLCGREFDNHMSLQLHFINHAILFESDTDPDIFDQYFFCRVCGETFNISEDVQNHKIKCSPESEEFKCATCEQLFDSELLLLKHEKEFSHGDHLWDDYLTKTKEKELYTCPVCNEEFPQKSELNLHSVRHIIKKITCRICKRTFSCQIAHNNHLKSHPKYKHMCKLCGKWLGSRHALKTHIMGVHSATKNFICTVCSKAFKTPSRLYIHKLTHKEDKKFICSICNYKTNYVGDFRVHNRIHTSERPYKCNFVNCKRQFKTSSHLNEHIQRHLQIKKYQCNMCCMVFGHNHTLKMHLMVHTGEKPFTCEICKIKFRRKHHLKNHMKQHPDVEIEKT